MLFFNLQVFSQKKRILYEQIALDYFVDSIWIKNKAGNIKRTYIVSLINPESTYLRAPFKFSNGEKLRDSITIETQRQRFKSAKDLDLSRDTLIVSLETTGFTYISPIKNKKVDLKKSKVIEVYKRLPFRNSYCAVEITVSTHMRCDFYYFEIGESEMHVTRWYNTFLVF